ncbi:carboxypeptidase-like regulatory domain-containing protein, partial [bacterium]|nr:carboxypeptidase-like regulatory domain-containing protein [bacterium]
MTKFAVVCVLLLSAIAVYADDPPIITGQIAVFGSRITVSPPFIETPSGIPVFINTTGSGINGVLKGELRGPSIPGSLTFETVPGQPFQLPGLTTQGNYSFEDIRLMNGDQVVTMATPDHVEIHVIEILITSLSSRPLTLEEIRALGIVINENDFSAVSFNIALTFNSQQIQISFPMLMPKRPNLQPVIPPPINGVGLIGPPPPGVGPELPGALPYIVPMDFKSADPDFNLALPDIPGILVFPNEIAFLNQFFSVLLMVRNGASEDSPLAVKDLTSQIILDPDDVKLVRTNPIVPIGAPVPVRDPGADGITGTADDLEIILAAQTGQAEFFVEGLTEGTHIVRMNLNGTLQGLAQGDVEITGSATGAILVRNPNFSLTFSHPSVVRAHEEYDLFVTITNTSTVDANLVRLTIPINALVNCLLKSDPFQEFETIASGESATAKFRLEPLVTGQVNAAVMTGSGNVQGKFEFRVGVGEEGIPLSPNTLVLPEYANSLGPDFLEKALSFLGLAYSSATAPPGSLPPGVPYVSKAVVFQRAVEIAQGGQRFQIGESRDAVLSHLLLDLLGNSVPDQPIDQLRRTTQKGRLLLDEILRQMNLGSTNAIALHHDFADATFFRNPYLSVMLNSAGSSPNLTITDSLNQSIASTGGEFGPYLGIPYGDLLRSEDSFAHWGIIGSIPPEFPTTYFYTIDIEGNGSSQTVSLIVPFGQNFYKVDFPSFATVAGTNYSLLIDQQALNSGTFQIKDPSGTVVASAVLAQVNSTQTSIIAARQDAKADKTGHIVAVLFNRPLTQDSAETLSNYFVEKNSVVDAQLQIGGRIVYLAFQNPISPLLDNDLKVSGVDPPLSGGNATVRIQTTVTTDAGRVTGKVLGSDGIAVAFAPMQLLEIDSDDVLGANTLHVTATTITNAQGEYEFDYVRKLNRPFEVRVQDPVSGDVASASSIISFPQQLVHLDIVFLGRGTVQGLIYKMEAGNVVPVEGALVQAVSLNEQVYRSALSDSTGHYSIPDVAVGNVNLTAQNQFLDEPEPFFGAASTVIPSAGAIVDADIQVVSTPAGKISGRILQANGTDPIINAYVLFSVDVGADTPLVMATFSNENGWYGFDPVPAGLAQISARDTATGQTIGGTSVNIPPGGDVTANIVAQGTGSIEVFLLLAPGMQLSDIGVYVLGTPFNQNPVQAVPVRFDGVPVGSWTVQAINAQTGQIVSGKVTIPFASATGSIVLDFPDRGTIGGQIFNVDSTPAANSTVLLFGGILQSHLVKVTTADSQGNYLFEDVDFETYQVHAVSSNQNDGGESPIVTITEQKRNGTANVTFYGKGTVNVHVESSGGPVVVQVRLDTVTFDSDGRIRREISYYKTTNTDGDTSFPNLFRRNFTVVVDNPGGAPTIISDVLDGPTKQVNILLSDNPSVSGVVHDANGIPIQAQVTYEQGNQTVVTDPQGQFSFVNIPLGPATFTAAAAGSLGQVTIAVQPTNPFIDIHLLGFGNVFGMVKDGSGNPVANADVKMTVPGLLQRVLFTETDVNGIYQFNAVPEESVAIEATNGISAGRGGVKIIHNADVSLDITLTATGTVQGTVFKANGNTTIANAEVSLFRNGGGNPIGIAASDSNGDFQFLYVPVGSYRLAAIDNNTGRRGESEFFNVTTDGETVDQDVLMEAQGKVHGVIYDYTGTNPIAGANITLVSHGLIRRTLLGSSGADGSFNFPAVPQGSYTITATSELLAGQAAGSIDAEDQDNVENILLQESASIEGTILFVDQTPIPAGVVPIIDLSGNDITLRIDAPAGEFHVEDLPLGDYTLVTRFSYNGVPYRGIAQITLSIPGPSGLTMILKGLKTLNVTVLGSLLDVTTVKLTYNNDMEKRTETHAIGGNTTSFLFVPESTFTITARTEDADSGAVLSGSASGTIVGDGLPPVDLSVTVAPSGTVKGVVTDSQSNPVDNVSLTLTTGNTNLFGFTDIAGNF